MIKAKDIYYSFIKDNSKYKIYLIVDDKKLLNMKMETTYKGKANEGSRGYLYLDQMEGDIIRSDQWFMNLTKRGYNINSIDVVKQFQFLHFEYYDETLVFVFNLNKKEGIKEWKENEIS